MSKQDNPLTIEDVLKFPCPFVIKIMGTNVPELTSEVAAIVSRHSAEFEPERDMTFKPSSKGNYVSINATIEAKSKQQLDDIYTDLNKHNLVKITL